jgi:hypothetical protein
MSMGRVIGIGTVSIFVFGGGMIFAQVRKSAADRDLYAMIHSDIARCKGYAANPAFYDYISEQCHKDAFEHNYHFEFRRRSMKGYLDEHYVDEVIDCMIQKAKDEGSPQVAAELEAVFTEDTEARADPKANRQ